VFGYVREIRCGAGPVLRAPIIHRPPGSVKLADFAIFSRKGSNRRTHAVPAPIHHRSAIDCQPIRLRVFRPLLQRVFQRFVVDLSLLLRSLFVDSSPLRQRFVPQPGLRQGRHWRNVARQRARCYRCLLTVLGVLTQKRSGMRRDSARRERGGGRFRSI